MSLMDEFETGPAEGLQQPIKMRDPYALQLTPQELVILASFVKSPMYFVFQKLSEGLIEKTETAHFKTWKEPETFQRTGMVAVAQRMFYESLQSEMKKMIDEFASELDFIKQKKDLLNTPLETQIKKEFE